MVKASTVPDVTFEQLGPDLWTATPNSREASEAAIAVAVGRHFTIAAGLICLEPSRVDELAEALEAAGLSTVV